jgi:hypothetical protein
MARASAGLGWEVDNLYNNGADIYFKVPHAIKLDYVDLDVAYMVTAPSAGSAEVLFTLGLTSSKPQFGSPPHEYQLLPGDPDLGPGQLVNPADVSEGESGPSGGELVSVILKSWVPADGTGSQDQRHVTLPLSLRVPAGSYLTCHMDHAGNAVVDCEMQLVLGYTRT